MPIWVTALVLVLFVLLPIGISLLGLKQIFKVHRFRKGAVQTTGTVFDIKEVITRDEDTTRTDYQPTFEFSGPDGTMRRGTTLVASAKYDFKRGSMHAIMVNFNEPGTVHMPGNWPYLAGSAMAVIGAVIAHFGSGALS